MSNSEQNSVFNKELLKAWNIQRQCTMEEFVRRMREEKICPMFNSKENRKENFDMSMISVLTEKLRELENDPEIDCYGIRELNNICAQAADTIEALSAKLAAANMERSDRYCGGGWISCEDRLSDKEVLCCDQCGEMILGYIAEDEGSETGFSAENDSEYMYNCVKWMEKPKP